MLTVQEEYQKSIDEFKDIVISMVVAKFKDEGEVTPVVFGLCKVGDKHQIAVLLGLHQFFQKDVDKEAAAEIIKQFSKELKPLAICYISECWMTKYDLNEEPVDKDGNYKEDTLKPSQHPNRQEVLILKFETHDKECNIMYEIVRKDNKVDLTTSTVSQLDWENKPKTYTRGLFDDLLKDNYSEYAQGLQETLKNKTNMN